MPKGQVKTTWTVEAGGEVRVLLRQDSNASGRLQHDDQIETILCLCENKIIRQMHDKNRRVWKGPRGDIFHLRYSLELNVDCYRQQFGLNPTP